VSFFRKIFTFITSDVWNIRLADLARVPSFFLKQIRIMLLAFYGLKKDKCPLKASALTYYSLLSIVPILAIGFGIAKGFGFEAILREQLLEKFAAHEAILTKIMDSAQILLKNTEGSTVAVIGIILLLWIVLQMLTNIEKTFNDIWHVKKVRSLGRKFSDYLSILLVGPVFVTFSVSLTVIISTSLSNSGQSGVIQQMLTPVLTILLHLLPYLVIWIFFTFLFMVIPNTRVNFRSGLIAGIIAGTIYQLVQWGYIEFQIGVAKYNAIYGSFAAIPLFFVWLQISWLVVLFGVEVAYAHQNVEAYEFATDCSHVSYRYQQLLTLRILHLLVSVILKGEQPLTAKEISIQLEIPIRLVNRILSRLAEAGLCSETVARNGKEPAWLPAGDVNQFTLRYVMTSLDTLGVNDIHVLKDEKLDRLSRTLLAFDRYLEKAPENTLLKDL